MKAVSSSKCYIFSSSLATKIADGTLDSIVRKNLSNYDYIAGPVIRKMGTYNHWCLLFVSVKSAEVIYIDPLLADIDKQDQVLANWNKFCKNRIGLKEKKWHKREVKNLIQTDGYNCGVYVCHFYNLLAKHKLFSLNLHIDINEYREIIVSNIKNF